VNTDAAAQAIATALAIALTARRRDHAPGALFLLAHLVTSLGRTALVLLVLAPERARIVASGLDPATVPFTSPGALAAVYLDGALWLAGGPAALAALCLGVFASRRWVGLVALVWAGASVGLALAYPLTRGEVLALCYFAAQLAALVVSLAVLVLWAWRRQEPRVSHAVGLLAVAVAMAEIGPWSRGDVFFFSSATDMHSLLYLAVILVSVLEVCSCSSPSLL
jgi:hypothetical protein